MANILKRQKVNALNRLPDRTLSSNHISRPALSDSSLNSTGDLINTQIGNAYGRQEKDPYMDLYEAYQSQLQSNAASQKEYLQKMYGETADILNKNYDKSANNAYINYRQSQAQLPEQLSNLGITGGASESANLKLQSAYGTNLSNNEFSRNNDIASARRDLAQGTNEVDSDLNSQLANAYADYGLKSLEYKQTQEKEKKAKEEQANVDKWNSSVMANIAKRQRQGYEVTTWNDADGKLHYRILTNAEKKQSKIDKWNNSVQKNIAKAQRQGYNVYTWTDGSGKIHYSKIGKKKLTSSGGSTRKSGGSSGGSGGTGSLPDVLNTGPTKAQKHTFSVLQTNIANSMLAYPNGKAHDKKVDSLINMVYNYYDAKKITKSQRDTLLKGL